MSILSGLGPVLPTSPYLKQLMEQRAAEGNVPESRSSNASRPLSETETGTAVHQPDKTEADLPASLLPQRSATLDMALAGLEVTG